MNAGRAEALLVSPIGASLLDVLEATAVVAHGVSRSPWDALPASEPARVLEAGDHLESMSATALLEAVFRAAGNVGAWAPSGPQNAAHALQLASQRRALADALVARPDVASWSAPMAAEQWWWSDGAGLRDGRLGHELGRLPAWATRPAHQVLTTSPVDLALTDSLVDSWEMVFGALSRWRLLVPPGARVYELDGPDDWAALVQAYPDDTTELYGRVHASWELRDPGSQSVDMLLALEEQRAARRGWRRVLTPDWDAVARDWDGVHLTWFGFVTADGTITDLGDGDVTILRHWGSERTAWLNPVLGSPTPMPPPPRTGRIGGREPPMQPGRTPASEEQWLRSVVCG
jgi:hypothetical protein